MPCILLVTLNLYYNGVRNHVVAFINLPELYMPLQKVSRISNTHKCLYLAILHLCLKKEAVKIIVKTLHASIVLHGQTLFRTEGKGLEHGQSNLSPRNLISHVNPVMMSVMAIAKVRLVTFLHLWLRFSLGSSSSLKTLLAQCLQVPFLRKLKFEFSC